jgi:proline racemase
VTLQNVPSFLYKPDVKVDVPGVGEVKVDIAYGGNFYAILPGVSVGLEIRPEHADQIRTMGTSIWRAVNEQVEIHHPEKPEINCVNYVEFSGPPTIQGYDEECRRDPTGRHRSLPCGTGTSAKMATLYAKGELKLNEEFVHESIIGSLFFGRLIQETKVGNYRSVIPTIRGSAHIMGIHQFVLDPRDPFPAGFLVGRKEKLYGVEFEH